MAAPCGSAFPRTPPHHLILVLLMLTATFPIPSHSTRPPFACARGTPSSILPFCRANLPIHARVRDLLGRLTLDEKVLMLVNNAAGSPRLGIARYEWWSEALHGVSNTGPGVHFGGAFPGATSFPQVITSAASFNASLWELIGKAVSDEARAMYNGGQAGLSFWSPNVNIFRDPRWGRGQETPGEDPLVAGKYAAAYVRGLQQPYAGNRLKLAACCKHYTAYDLDNWKGNDRFHFDARVTKQDLEDTFNVPFEVCVKEGKAAAVMCSYNKVNGVPTCADKGMLLDTIRGRWGLAGYVASDCDSVGVFYDQMHYAPNPAVAAADAIKAGLDLDCGPFLALHTAEALQQRLIGMPDVDNALANTITVQMRLGMYDGDPAVGPFGHLGPRDVCTPEHQMLALEAARQGIVLLKNDRNTLPLSPQRLRSVAVLGPNADATVTMIGNYAGIPCGYTSPLLGISRYMRTVHQSGCVGVACSAVNPHLEDAAVFAATQADATVLVMGLDQSVEAEARDRVTLLLPGRQQELISKVATASRGPVVLVLMCGGPVDITFAKNDPRIAAILWVGYPGQAGGTAIADVIFGAYNPGGKLPMTWYPQAFVDRIPMTDMAMRADSTRGYPGRTYRFYNGPIVYPFGHGLTYTSFHHAIAQAPASLSVQLMGNRAAAGYNASDSSSSASAPTLLGQAVRVTHARCDGLVIPIHVDVSNDGDRDGAHTVMVFSNPPAQAKQGRGSPTKQLVGFQKVHVMAKSQATVEFAIDVCRDLSFADSLGVRRIPIGVHQLQIGELTHTLSLLVDGSDHL